MTKELSADDNRLAAFFKPVGYCRGHGCLGLAADVNADMAARKRQFGVILAANQRLQRFRCSRWHQVILFGVNVQYRNLQILEINVMFTDL